MVLSNEAVYIASGRPDTLAFVVPVAQGLRQEEVGMKVGVLGSGAVGRAIAGKVAAIGHDVTMGTRDVDQLMARCPEGSGHANA